MGNSNDSQPRKARNLEEIRRVCRPLPLTGKQLDLFFVETDSARDPHQATRQRIKDALNMGADIRLLFYGHRGSGDKNPPRADAVNQILLKSCALVEYNGEGWLGVHPLVMKNLKALGRLV